MDTFFSALRGIDWFLLSVVLTTPVISFFFGILEAVATLLISNSDEEVELTSDSEEMYTKYVEYVGWATFAILIIVFWTNTDISTFFGFKDIDRHVYFLVSGLTISAISHKKVMEAIHEIAIGLGIIFPALCMLAIVSILDAADLIYLKYQTSKERR